MRADAMQVTSGRVLSVSQRSAVIRVWSPNLGPTTDRGEEITLRLDSIERPLILKTSKTYELFIAQGDQLDVACIECPDGLAIFGIRNAKDGSVYLVRPANVVGARRDIYVAISCVIACGICSGIVGFVQRSTHHLLDLYLIGMAASVGLCATSTIVRSLFGWNVWPDLRTLVQPGGKREVNAARKALALEPGEAGTVRFL